MKKWKCNVCGYIHEGEELVALCPICEANEFQEFGAAESQDEKRWHCKVCGYLYVGSEPPAACPLCGAPQEAFVLLKNKMSVF